jgi:5'(3')-deoxyribonucleotidase
MSEINMSKKILYIDMDGVLANFDLGLKAQSEKILEDYKGKEDNIPNIFSQLLPIEGAVESFMRLSEIYDVYILSTAPWDNVSAWSDKLLWVKKYFGENARKRLILTHRKDLNIGDYLIDDRTKNGADNFCGELIQFASDKFPDWKAVCEYLL